MTDARLTASGPAAPSSAPVDRTRPGSRLAHRGELRLAQRISRMLWCVIAVVFVAHSAHTLLGTGALDWLVSGWTTFGVFLACAAVTFARALAYRPEQLAWSALGAGLAAYALGQAYYVLITSKEPAASFLNGSNLLWLSLYPLALLAIVALVRAQGVRVRWELWLDGVTGGLVIGSLGLVAMVELVINPLTALHAAPANLAFALGDLLLVGFGVGACGLLGWRPPRSLIVLIAAFAAQGLQDTAFLDQLLRGTYGPGTWLDSAWLLGLLSVTAAAAWPRPSRATVREVKPRALVAFPLAFTLGALALAGSYALDEALADPVSGLTVALIMLALVAVVVRCGFTFRAHVSMIEAKERSEAHLAQAQRLAGVGSWELHALEDRITWSAEQARLLNWPHAEPPAGVAAALELVDPEDRAKVAAALDGARETGGSASFDFRVSGAEGVRIIHCQGEALRDGDGRWAGLIGTCQDVTDRFRRAEAERANQAKSEFLSRMSHELRTPLNAVLGFGQLLGASELDDRQRANVDQILSAGRHLLTLINEVLDISRIEAGELTVSLEPVRLATVLDDTVELIAPLAAARRVSLTTIPDETHAWVHADQQRLKQVLLNLLSNAVKYNRDDGQVEIRVEPSGSDRVRVVVADTGTGIAPDKLPRLFSPFERLGAEHSDIEGTGLGLSLSKSLVEAMGGTIEVASTPGAGSTFTVELGAAEPVHFEATLQTGADHATAPIDGDRRTVLCIEDNVANLELIEQIFASRPDIELLTAVQGTIGAELARRHLPNLVLLDLNLPDIGGDEVLARLHADPATKHIPVVILSADATDRQIERLVARGAHAYLTKPIDVAELMRVVDDVRRSPDLSRRR
jgi:signal transduction histidine kinase/CheY-like chemotaxis protein